MRIPTGNGEAIAEPSLEVWPELLRANQNLFASCPVPQLRTWRRAAREYLNQHFGIGAEIPLLITGHQPQWIHPGIWVRYFLLQEASRRWGWQCAAFQVDSDVAEDPTLHFPFFDGRNWSQKTIPIEVRGGMVYESLAAPTEQAWQLLLKLVQQTLAFPEGQEAWEQVRNITTLPSTGQSYCSFLSSLRQCKEQAIYPEFPFSHICRQQVFGQFAGWIGLHAAEFAQIHNQVAKEWRQRKRARSDAVPFPDLSAEDGKVEVPFWWIQEGVRFPLFLQGEEAWANQKSLGSWMEALESGMVRPRAITLTIFVRLFLADLFLHGAGGSDYEEATDQVIQRFFGLVPPGYAWATLTLFFPGYRQQPLQEARIRMKEMEQHPESFLISEKGPLLHPAIQEKRELLNRGKLSKEQYRRLQQCNETMRANIAGLMANQRSLLEGLERRHQVLAQRNYPFILFDSQLMRRITAALSS
jgi:hypothetical protein